MSIEFTDNTLKVKEALNDSVKAFLDEAGGELRSRIVRNSRTDQGDTKGSYDYKVIEGSDESTVYVGSPLENAIWEEFGTGEYALHGDGRKGGWYIPEEKLTAKAKSKMRKVVGKNGKVFYYTKGKKPNRPMYKAITALRPKLQRMLEQKIKERLG